MSRLKTGKISKFFSLNEKIPGPRWMMWKSLFVNYPITTKRITYFNATYKFNVIDLKQIFLFYFIVVFKHYFSFHFFIFFSIFFVTFISWFFLEFICVHKTFLKSKWTLAYTWIHWHYSRGIENIICINARLSWMALLRSMIIKMFILYLLLLACF